MAGLLQPPLPLGPPPPPPRLTLGLVLSVKTRGLNDFSRAAKGLSKLGGGRNEQRQVLRADVRGRAGKNKRANRRRWREFRRHGAKDPEELPLFFADSPSGAPRRRVSGVRAGLGTSAGRRSYFTPCPNQPARFINSGERGWSNPRLSSCSFPSREKLS